MLLLTIFVAVTIGPAAIPFSDSLAIIIRRIPILGEMISSIYPPSWETIIIGIRLPRVLLGAFVGMSLAVAGTCMQGLFRNPMADPFVIGISSGAALGAAITLVLETIFPQLRLYYIASVLAFAGALIAVFLVYNISKVNDVIPVETLLLAGVAVASLLSAITSIVVFAYSKEVVSVLFWITGSLGASKWADVGIVSATCLAGVIALFLFSRDLNSMLLGEETAQNLGVEVENMKKIVLVLSSLITATAVATSGTIGFVGLVIPHVMRLIVGPDHRILIPSSALFGSIFLIWCDVIAGTVIEVPVAMITALFGAPFFIYLLWRRRRLT
jgi:iron complex transport system permease protein